MNDFVAFQISSRFIFVNVLPNTLFVALVGGLVAAGAPDQAPSWSTLVHSITELSWTGGILVALGIVVASVVLHPLSYPLIQVLEGYWDRFPTAGQAHRLGAARYKRWRMELAGFPNVERVLHDLADLPADNALVLPTTLGNVLRAGELRAGSRYGYETATAWRRLFKIATPDAQGEVRDTRNQLDSAARLCITGLLCVPVTTWLLWSHQNWLLVPLGCYLFAWAAYRAAIAAARRFCDALAVAFDMHHLELWDALSLPRPKTLLAERDQAAPQLCKLLAGTQPLQVEEEEEFEYGETTRPQYGIPPPSPFSGQP
ncbi:hypothetical protein [Jidongwangia harbinensis]|uniref:hypothetical protein n=1 Tax=Jidongwangia harbinensis TaxID=2878561 RepID=UPI001CD9CB87|nr:hypothetical protein [Jidongwangia harbinensis]MCA2216311.1 hypothetical protein [Jidongwangia harbinensis]MCA2217046.1 hypothetical protein [Jidongwangia harbinensis]